MILSRLSRGITSTRNIMTSAIRRHDDGGRIGANLPFDIHNKYKVTFLFTAFFGSAMAIPFFVVKYQMTK